MVKRTQQFQCEYCGETYQDVPDAHQCEYQHEIHDAAGKLSVVRDVEMQTVYDDIIEWLELSLDSVDPVFGAITCPRCSEAVHETWMECPSCNVLLHDHATSGTLACGACGSMTVRVVRKDGVTKGLGVQCETCGEFVAHGRGVFGVIEETPYEWVEDDAE